MDSDLELNRRTAAAPDFPVYGLPTSWGGRRAIDAIVEWRDAGAQSFTTYGLWLGHYDSTTMSGARIGTFEPKRLGQAKAVAEPDLAAALLGVSALVDLTLPGADNRPSPKPFPAPVNELVRRAEAFAYRRHSWPTLRWHVDNTDLEARVLAFAGAWTGYTMTGEALVVVGVGLPPEGLRLAVVTDGAPYGFAVGQPLDRWHARQDNRDCPETILAKPNPDAWHPDYVALAGRQAEQ